MRIDLLPSEGQFYKANLHAHTTLSDGHWTPQELKDAYKTAGYAVVAYTDHRYYVHHTELDDTDFLALAAYEVDINRPAPSFNHVKTYHINLYDTCPAQHMSEKFQAPLPEMDYDDLPAIRNYLKQMRELGFIACYNHAYWSLQDVTDYRDLDGLFAMEIYNHGCEYDGLYGYTSQVYDEMLRTGQHLLCVATDDNHNTYPIGHPRCDSFGGFTMIKAPELTYDAIMNALQAGHFYASSGPEIHELYLDGRTLVVRCSPVEKIYGITDGRACYSEVADCGETITEARFELSGNEQYIRIDCRDNRGFHAYSNAYWADTLFR